LRAGTRVVRRRVLVVAAVEGVVFGATVRRVGPVAGGRARARLHRHFAKPRRSRRWRRRVVILASSGWRRSVTPSHRHHSFTLHRTIKKNKSIHSFNKAKEKKQYSHLRVHRHVKVATCVPRLRLATFTVTATLPAAL